MPKASADSARWGWVAALVLASLGAAVRLGQLESDVRRIDDVRSELKELRSGVCECRGK